MNFKQWLEDTTLLVPTNDDDPELNGLARGLAYYKPVPKRKSRDSQRIAKLFGKNESSKPRDYGAGFVFTDGKSILLLLRSPDVDDPKTWCLPGGGAKGREMPRETAEREAREEIGVVKGNTFYTSNEGHWVFFFNKVDKPFKCKLNKENTKWEWVKIDKLKSYKLHPKLKKKIDRYISEIKKEFER